MCYRCSFCGDVVPHGTPLLRHTRHSILLPKILPKRITTTDEYGKSRVNYTTALGRKGKVAQFEVPTCQKCFSLLQCGLTEAQLVDRLRLSGKGFVNKRIVTYDGLTIHFGGGANKRNGSAIQAPPVKIVSRFAPQQPQKESNRAEEINPYSVPTPESETGEERNQGSGH